jgi:hypothetical protein
MIWLKSSMSILADIAAAATNELHSVSRNYIPISLPIASPPLMGKPQFYLREFSGGVGMSSLSGSVSTSSQRFTTLTAPYVVA